jgi:hypothetical protein
MTGKKNNNESNNRRGFLRLLGGGALAAALTMEGQESHGDTGDTAEMKDPTQRRLPKLQFRGSSKTGDVEEALKNAIKAAERSVRHPDAMVEWTLKSITGRNGGFAGFNDVTVIIEAKVS